MYLENISKQKSILHVALSTLITIITLLQKYKIAVMNKTVIRALAARPFVKIKNLFVTPSNEISDDYAVLKIALRSALPQ